MPSVFGASAEVSARCISIVFRGVPPMTLGTLRSDDGDGNENENVIKAIVLISKTTTFHAHPTLLCTFVVFARLRSENA